MASNGVASFVMGEATVQVSSTSPGTFTFGVQDNVPPTTGLSVTATTLVTIAPGLWLLFFVCSHELQVFQHALCSLPFPAAPLITRSLLRLKQETNTTISQLESNVPHPFPRRVL